MNTAKHPSSSLTLFAPTHMKTVLRYYHEKRIVRPAIFQNITLLLHEVCTDIKMSRSTGQIRQVQWIYMLGYLLTTVEH